MDGDGALPIKPNQFGIDVIDELLQGELPRAAILLVLADPATGKSILCKQFINHGLMEGGHGIYVSFDETAEEVMVSSEKFGWKLSEFERTNHLQFLDLTATNPSDINSINIRLTEALEAMKFSSDVRVAVDSLTSPLMATKEARLGLDFVRLLNTKMKAYGFSALYTLNRQGFEEKSIALIKDACDGIIEMKLEEEEKTLRSYLRILKMRDTSHSRRWIPYTVDSENGIRFYIPKILLLGPKGAGKTTMATTLVGNQPTREISRVNVGDYAVDLIIATDLEGDFARHIRSKEISGTVLIVDSSALETFSIAAEALKRIEIGTTPHVIFANKQDLPDAITPQNLIDELGVPKETLIIGTSGQNRNNLEEGLKILLRKILKIPI